MKIFFKLFVLILLQNFFYSASLEAQATLSIQGILKRANGGAVDDGVYAITFRLYEQETGSTSSAIWTETQSDVEVFSGIYSAVLGQSSPLNVPFDQLYYLGVSIGSTEMTPRILLTSAPYALSLIGSTNQFPSSGKVIADSLIVGGGITVGSGIPGNEGQTGYGFNNDGNTGVFSTGDGNTSIYSNNNKVIDVSSGQVDVDGDFSVNGTLNTENVNLSSEGKVNYNGIADWRLVDVDDFSNNSTEEWLRYAPTPGEHIGWKNADGNTPQIENFTAFAGPAIRPNDVNEVLKKQFIIPGSFTQIKVKFKYHFLESWGFGPGDLSFAAFASSVTGNDLRVGWSSTGPSLSTNGKFNTSFKTESNYYTDIAYWGDHWINAEMVGQAVGNSFWVFVGAAVDANPEQYALGHVEIWVR